MDEIYQAVDDMIAEGKLDPYDYTGFTEDDDRTECVIKHLDGTRWVVEFDMNTKENGDYDGLMGTSISEAD